MSDYYIKVGSITNAQRGQKLLRSKGYKAQIRRSENPSDSDGCGYMLVVSADSDYPLSVLSSNGIDVKGAEKK